MTSLAEDAGPNPHGADAERRALDWEAPLHLVNGANQREHWGAKQRRAKMQRDYAAKMTNASRQIGARHPFPPYRITITRIGPRRLDSDGATISAKHVRDGISDCLGINDGDENAAEWIVLQEIGKAYGVRVRIEGRSG
jgi:hypothetical protein